MEINWSIDERVFSGRMKDKEEEKKLSRLGMNILDKTNVIFDSERQSEREREWETWKSM